MRALMLSRRRMMLTAIDLPARNRAACRDGLHQRGVACSAHGKPVVPHLVCQTGGVAATAGHSARQEKASAARRGQRIVELDLHCLRHSYMTHLGPV